MENLLLWISAELTEDRFVFLTRIQAILWSLADIVLVYFFLKISDLARTSHQLPKLRTPYYLLWLSAALTPLLLFTKTVQQIFILESVVCGTQFGILVVTAIRERLRLIAFFKTVIKPYKDLTL